MAGQSRNDIRFRGYQKFGSELKIIDDDEDVPPEKPDETKKPDKPPSRSVRLSILVACMAALLLWSSCGGRCATKAGAEART